MIDISIYCLCYQFKENKDTQFIQKNLMCGAIDYDQKYKEYLNQNKFLFDDTEDNISNLNNYFGQLTGLYWVWKNTSDEIIGTNTYRIFWDNNLIFLPNKIYTPVLNLTESLYSQYLISYLNRPIYINGLNLLYSITKKHQLYLTTTMLNKSYSQKLLYLFLMFICERKTFNKICEILFDIIFDLWYNYQEYLLEFTKIINLDRIFDILGERIVTIILLNINYFISNTVEIIPTTTYQYNHNNYTKFNKIE